MWPILHEECSIGVVTHRKHDSLLGAVYEITTPRGTIVGLQRHELFIDDEKPVKPAYLNAPYISTGFVYAPYVPIQVSKIP